MLKTLVVTAFAVVCYTLSAQNIQSIAVGSSAKKALEYKMKDATTQHSLSIADVTTKKGVLIMFSCNTCPYVIKNQERTLEAIKLAKDKGLGVIIVNSNEDKRNDDDSYEAMQEYAAKQGYTCSYVVDNNSEVANIFGATRTPEIFILDADGKVIYKGSMDDSPADANKVKRKHLQFAVEEYLSGKPLTISETKGVGCTIKRKA